MKHLFVPYELALSLKEKGFDEPCLGGYTEEGEFAYPDQELNTFINRHRSGGEISAPLYQQVIDWLREKHEIHLSILHFWNFEDSTENYQCNISQINNEVLHTNFCATYYSALQEGIKEALKLI